MKKQNHLNKQIIKNQSKASLLKIFKNHICLRLKISYF